MRDSVRRPGGIRAVLTSCRSTKAFVWALWFFLLLLDLLVLVKAGRTIPVSEDWLLVGRLTGHDSDLIRWLWAANNEHRLPFPRLVMLGLLKISAGDWRSGMLFNILLLGGLAAACILAARKLRNGRTAFADIIFPIALISLGNWENLFWNWQVTQVIATVLPSVLLLLIVTIEKKLRPVTMMAAALILILLPLSGANGLLWLPANLLFFTFYGWHCYRRAPAGSASRRSAGLLLAAALLSLLIAAAYMVGLRQPQWMPPNPGLLRSFYAVLQILALGIGPIARAAWFPIIMVVLLIILPSAVILLHAVYHYRGTKEEIRAVGLLAFFSNALFFAVVLGFARAGVIGKLPGWMLWPLRYGQFVAPLLFAAYFVWLLYLPPKWSRPIATSFALLALLLIPINTVIAYGWQASTARRDEQILAHIQAGVPIEHIANKFRDYTWSWAAPGELEDHLLWLKELGLPPFDDLPRDLQIAENNLIQQASIEEENANTWPEVEIHYPFPQAEEVFVVWGISGWQTIPAELQPPSTELDDGVMKSPMSREEKGFIARVRVPPKVTLQYGFESNGRPIWLQPYYLAWDFSHEDILVGEENIRLEAVPYPKLTLPNLSALLLLIIGLFIIMWVILYRFIPVDR